MAQFTLEWLNAAALASSNATGQRALYRYKAVGGAFLTVGFDPVNDLPASANTVDSPDLDSNKVIEFKVQCLCSVNGPIDNDNGIQEVIAFACLTPVITKTYEQSIITLDVTGLDITKARFTLRKAADNTIVGSAVVVSKSGTSISTTKTGLLEETNYYWQVELYANINNVEVISSQAGYLGAVCSPYPFTTDEAPFCDPLTEVTVSSIEIV